MDGNDALDIYLDTTAEIYAGCVFDEDGNFKVDFNKAEEMLHTLDFNEINRIAEEKINKCEKSESKEEEEKMGEIVAINTLKMKVGDIAKIKDLDQHRLYNGVNVGRPMVNCSGEEVTIEDIVYSDHYHQYCYYVKLNNSPINQLNGYFFNDEMLTPVKISSPINGGNPFNEVYMILGDKDD